MAHVTREEMQAAFSAAQARTDAQFAELRAVIEGYSRVADERAVANDQRALATEQRMQRIEQTCDDIRKLIEDQRKTMIVTAITAVIATVLGVGSFNAALQSNMLTALSHGKEAAEILAEARKQREESARSITEAQAEMRRLLEKAPAMQQAPGERPAPREGQ